MAGAPAAGLMRGRFDSPVVLLSGCENRFNIAAKRAARRFSFAISWKPRYKRHAQ